MNHIKCELKILFLQQLDYWISQGKYGIEKNGKIWIYNSLEDWAKQLKCSKSTVQRVIKKLKEDGIIESDYLAHNKRNRTLFYTINYEKLNESDMVKKYKNLNKKDHIVDHMYYIDNNNKDINKSYKSQKNSKQNLKKFNEDDSKILHVQEMFDLAKSLLKGKLSEKILTKELAKALGAARKWYFTNLESWKWFLTAIQKSIYLMGEKFNLSLSWILKFSTIKRVKNNEFGVDWSEQKNEENKTNYSNKESELIENINLSCESERIKNIRKTFLKTFGIFKYKSLLAESQILEDFAGNITINLIKPSAMNTLRNFEFSEFLHKNSIKINLDEQNIDRNSLNDIERTILWNYLQMRNKIAA